MSASSLFQEPGGIPSGSSPLQLRPYQEEALQAIADGKARGTERGIVVLPTGTGKTVLFAELIRRLGLPAIVVAHRDELLRQARDEIAGIIPGVEVGIECGSERAAPWSNVVVASVQTIGRPGSTRPQGFKPGAMIIDEAHHAPATTYQNTMERFGSYEGRCFTLGCTATDHRLDNKALHGRASAVFEEVLYRYPLRQAIVDGWLVPIRGFRVESDVDLSGIKTVAGDYNQRDLQRKVNTQARNKAALRHWQDVAADRRTIVFCAGVEHAIAVAQLFREAGISAETVNGGLSHDERSRIIANFRSGATQVLTNVDIATEGFNVREIACVLMLRPTQSWSIYTQMAGRGTRVLGRDIEESRRLGKEDVLVIDVVDNSGRHSLATVPSLIGLPSNFDLGGRSIEEAAKALDGLGAAAAGIGAYHPTNFEQLDTMMREVDLLGDIGTPDDLKGQSNFHWLAIGEGLILDCGSSEKGARVARIEPDALGRFSLALTQGKESLGDPVRLGDNRAKAVRSADVVIRRMWPKVGVIASSDAHWRGLAPSPKQIELLRKLGLDPGAIPDLTRGKASLLIGRKIRV